MFAPSPWSFYLCMASFPSRASSWPLAAEETRTEELQHDNITLKDHANTLEKENEALRKQLVEREEVLGGVLGEYDEMKAVLTEAIAEAEAKGGGKGGGGGEGGGEGGGRGCGGGRTRAILARARARGPARPDGGGVEQHGR